MLNTKMSARIACCVAIALGSVALAAQQRSTSAAGERGDLDEIRKVSSLIGTNVMNRANTKVADFRDLMLSPDGEILYAILGYGGVGGVGETYTAAPLDALQVRHVDGKWTVGIDRTAEVFKQAPTIQSENYRELTDPQWVARANQFFRRSVESKAEREKGTAVAHREPKAVEWVLLASKIRSAKLKNTQNEELGKLEDLLLDRNDRVVFAVVGKGGVLGVGAEYVPIPWSKLGLSYNPENAAVTASIDATKAQLDKAPLIKGDNYATLLAPGFADEVRRFFGAIGHSATPAAGKERR